MDTLASALNSTLKKTQTLKENVSSSDASFSEVGKRQQAPLMSLETIGADVSAAKDSKQTGLQHGATGAAALAISEEQRQNPALLKETLLIELQNLKSGLTKLREISCDDLNELEKFAPAFQSVSELANIVCSAGGRKANTSIIQRLMMHYPQAYSLDGLEGQHLELMKNIRAQVLRDWAEDVEEYPEWVIEQAAKEWRRGEKGRFRPTIADIRSSAEWIMLGIKWVDRDLNSEWSYTKKSIEQNKAFKENLARMEVWKKPVDAR